MTSLDFAEAAKRIGGAARAAGHEAPSFRSPPRVRGCQRSIQRRRNGSATVAVAFKQRPLPSVLADMIDGVIATNTLSAGSATVLRDQLWSSVVDLISADQTGPHDAVPTEPVPITTVRRQRAA